VANERIFNPPNWIRIIMMTCPLKVKAVLKSRTVNPVIQLALVEVKRASIKLIGEVVIRGNKSKIVPIVMSKKKDKIINTGGDKRMIIMSLLAFEISIITMIRK
jgi:hypothetical protein